MRIGITEHGDASVDMRWARLEGLIGYDGAVLITKNITDEFIRNILAQNKPIIVHATCTGWGGSEMEPGVPDYKHQLSQLKKLIDAGFPASRCVLRIDPIFPTGHGLARVESVLNNFMSMDLGVDRIRVSIIDEYKHVKERYRAKGWQPLYSTKFGPSHAQVAQVAETLRRYPFRFEACAEPMLAALMDNVVQQGCVHFQDLERMGIPLTNLTAYENPQHRSGCHCLSVKAELLGSENRHPCKHNCVYCYWKHPGEGGLYG